MSLTNKIKSSLLHYLRFKNQSFVATEVSRSFGIADILYIPKKKEEVCEIEIKISKSDFLNEWIKKERKHKCLLSEVMNDYLNYFYFCVPIELKEFALEQLKNKPYGLYVFDEASAWHHKNKLQEQLDLSDCITVVKRATKLYKEKIPRFNIVKDEIALRAMSDLATMYKLQYYDGGKSSRNLIRDKVTI